MPNHIGMSSQVPINYYTRMWIITIHYKDSDSKNDMVKNKNFNGWILSCVCVWWGGGGELCSYQCRIVVCCEIWYSMAITTVKLSRKSWVKLCAWWYFFKHLCLKHVYVLMYYVSSSSSLWNVCVIKTN